MPIHTDRKQFGKPLVAIELVYINCKQALTPR